MMASIMDLPLERIDAQIDEWREEEPEQDWWAYQRDFKAMHDFLVRHCEEIEMALLAKDAPA